MLTVKRLDLADARILIEGAAEKAREIGVPMCIAITDESGNLIAFERMDGGKITSVTIAQDKATTSAGFGLPTKQWWPVLEGMNSPGLLAGIAAVPRMVVFGGGIPVYVGPDCIAGVGVSGGSEEEDEICARAGITAAGLSAEPGQR